MHFLKHYELRLIRSLKIQRIEFLDVMVQNLMCVGAFVGLRMYTGGNLITHAC